MGRRRRRTVRPKTEHLLSEATERALRAAIENGLTDLVQICRYALISTADFRQLQRWAQDQNSPHRRRAALIMETFGMALLRERLRIEQAAEAAGNQDWRYWKDRGDRMDKTAAKTWRDDVEPEPSPKLDITLSGTLNTRDLTNLSDEELERIARGG